MNERESRRRWPIGKSHEPELFPEGLQSLHQLPEGYKSILDLPMHLAYGILRSMGIEQEHFEELAEALGWQDLQWHTRYQPLGMDKRMERRFIRFVATVSAEDTRIAAQAVIDAPTRIPMNISTTFRFSGISRQTQLPMVLWYKPVLRYSGPSPLALEYALTMVPASDDQWSKIPPEISEYMITHSRLKGGSVTPTYAVFEHSESRKVVEPVSEYNPILIPVDSIPKFIGRP